MNGCVAPAGTVGLAGVTEMETSVGGACTVSVVCPVTPASPAEIVVAPPEIAAARPLALIVATPVLDDVHVTWLVMFCVLPSE